jgi:CubicO group peptidase (beta-lactamase class C family)
MKVMLLYCFLFFFSCNTIQEPDENDINQTVYFPPSGNDQWETILPEELGWDIARVDELYTLLEKNDTRAFIILKDGKIVVEQYFNKDLLGLAPFQKDKLWYWASAGKVLTGMLTGIAQEEGYLDIQNKSSDYLGKGWTSLPTSQEDDITVWHQLSMTTGLDETISQGSGFQAYDLQFIAPSGTRWSYHNAPYTLLDKVISNAIGEPFETYFETKIADKIGMDGQWRWLDDFHVYFSTARSMARFGLLIQNGGVWKDEKIISDDSFFSEMITTSQALNKSYGYLWWLNGKESYMLPRSQQVFPGMLVPDAPAEMIAALGKNGQFLCVVPSQGIVMVRMGKNPDESMVPLLFLREIWSLIDEIIKD